MANKLTIQQVAKATGLSVHAVRYYEKAGLLAPIQRASNGHRCYSSEDVVWLEFLIRLRSSGMSIQQIHLFAELVRHQPANVQERRLLLEAHRDHVQKSIQDLTENLRIIELKIKHYKHLEFTGESDKNCIFWKAYLEKISDDKLK
ncbi:MerR family transcriptional regulator [Rivularia sp. UHCC 0363]|uniref:MerR family transcriptional regulator n=1 Tax=Rivularia sp. UHCC 0363 TaxID=3110244 RepID=UPI002B20DB6F|nr:MerR family transcriptional regulator [Rivularia sp. UHCC 0363]MEA5598435.1 MerR family transcriptional regulator [Rivularia sp. UHCC 0363]